MPTACLTCSSIIDTGTPTCPGCGTPAPGVSNGTGSWVADELLSRLRRAAEGEFEVVREIGHGGMARVYLAYEVTLERHVAIKVLSPLFSEYPNIVKRFQHEARMAGRLSHPNIVPVYAVYQRGGLSYFSMPYVKGSSLRAVLRRKGRLALRDALDYLGQAAAGLAFAHERRVVHRDVKPENMMLEEPQGRLVLTDFGIAKALGGDSLTVPGDMIGTPHYMSPEQCEGRQEIDGRSDQYSLALVGYEMLTGSYAFEAEGLRELIMKQITEHPAPLSERRPDLPPAVCEAITRALSKDPEDRHPGVDAFVDALRGRAPATPRRPAEAEVAPSARAEAETVWMRDRLAHARGRNRLVSWVRRGGIVSLVSIALYVAASGLAGELRDGSAADSKVRAAAEFRDLRPEEVPGGHRVLGPPEPRPARSLAGADDDATTTRLAAAGSAARPGSERSTNGAPQNAARTPRGGDAPPASIVTKPNATKKPSVSRTKGDERPDPGPVAERLRPREADATRPESGGDAAPGLGAGAEGSLTAATDTGASDGASDSVDRPDGAAALTRADLEEVLERYRLALEARDLERLERTIYAASIPTADLDKLGTIVRNAEDLEVDLRVGRLAIDETTATAYVEHRMSFLLARTRRPREARVKFKMNFVAGPDGWRLAGLEQR